ncbi:MAG: hypothetical protein MUF85_01085 [Patescibacteria group bacterium]|nr:hypothetical protein [Patescibacteria group bacterium]
MFNKDPKAGQDNQEPKLPKGKFRLKVHAPFKVYYDDVVSSISAVNATGPFDILGEHHNFITLLSPCELVIRQETDSADPTKIKITRGIMQVKTNDVVVFLDV